MYDILIVDDEKIERNGIRFLLKQYGFDLNIYEANNGLKALEFLEKNKVDILLTDVKMPFMDGIELCSELRKRNLDMKILIFSGYSEFEYARMAVKLGVSEYILKPIDPDEFKGTITKVIRGLEEEKIENDKMETSKLYMIEHILYLMVNGTPYSEIKTNFSALLSLDFLKEFKRMLLIETNSEFFGREGNGFVKNLEQEIEEEYHYLNLNPQQSLLIFKDANAPLQDIAHNIHQNMKMKYQENGYVAIGNEIKDVDQLGQQLEVLEHLMENKFYVSNTYVFGGKEQSDALLTSPSEDDSLMKQMQQDMKMKDMSSLEEHLSLLYAKYQNNIGFSQIYVKFIFSNLLKGMHESIPNHTEVQFNQEIEELYRSVDFETVKEIVGRNVELLKKAFKQNPQMYHREIEYIKQYIYENYDKELGVEQLADKVSLAPSYLSHIFKKETGQNLSKFIKAYRMEMAKKMLEETHEKIVTISYAVGYVNVSYFCQSFREYFGVSPQKYRMQGE
ncbi:response regulator transcription factor [[Clostridium] polysaccharolyticum]|uniref:Stage 0 sporulation protein A homolog n=1 Tax=[Clostridium] polysaccharolyticum TaxID=29364 RepID=A0A1I0FY39_9FIRM|nr:response regulator [[Clostridium] polysaccharolyticum]SET62516.1 two-component system, response regulator YesN [[Clostridium] polysaccharolyticum]